MPSFATALAELREARGFSQARLARTARWWTLPLAGGTARPAHHASGDARGRPQLAATRPVGVPPAHPRPVGQEHDKIRHSVPALFTRLGFT